MPYRKKRTYRKKPARVYRKRTRPSTRRKAGGVTRYTSRISGPFRNFVSTDPFPPKKYCTLTYTSIDTLGVGALALWGANKIFLLNSIFDPDATGVGHQPYGHDQLALLYVRYKVHAVKLEITLSDPSDDGLIFGAHISNPQDTYNPTGLGITNLAEQPFSITREINNSGKQVVRIRQYFPMHVISGLTKLQFDADDGGFVANFGVNPTSTPSIKYVLANLRGAGIGTLSVTTKLTYFVQAYQRLTLGQS